MCNIVYTSILCTWNLHVVPSKILIDGMIDLVASKMLIIIFIIVRCIEVCPNFGVVMKTTFVFAD